MKTSTTTLCAGILALSVTGCAGTHGERSALRDALKDKFYIGTALSVAQLTGGDTLSERVAREHFSAIVPENCMKSMFLQPREGEFFFDEADKFVAWGEANNMWITGHCLVWHSQAPRWLCVDEQGNNVSPETLTERLKSHITTVVTRYKGRIKGWDVVNEAILEDGSWRKSKFYEILGEEFIPLAFQLAHDADPDAELYYNDYSMALEGKRSAVVQLVKTLKERGLRIDAVGMQGHIGMDYPAVEEFEKSLLAFAEVGVKVMITELDLTVLPSPRPNVGAAVETSFEYQQELNPYVGGLPDSVTAAWTSRMADFFRLFLKHQDKITRVTLWGVCDDDSWRNDWPVPGRTDYALLFDRNGNPKPVVEEIRRITNYELGITN
ncbi:MAG: endo-1,4-beta-xylanase [Prevotellaceae bacterium]|jgi:endo-1,4-beta-xylanase|nr:endo-1,4-beta-xylanase [Prevotellaceae bacterium]